MEQQFDSTNRGSLFKNDRKQTEKHPDYTGSITPECSKCGHKEERWLSAWLKTSKKNIPFMSISIGKPKEQRQQENTVSLEDVPF